MPLDVFTGAQRNAGAFIATRPGWGPGLDPTFGEAFGEALSSLVGTNIGIKMGAEKFNAVQGWLDQFQEATGEELQNPEMPSDGATRARLYGEIAARYASARAAKPDFALAPPPTEAQATETAMAALRSAAEEQAQFAGRPQTLASMAGSTLGGFASAAVDPVNLAAMAIFAPSQAGVLAFALREALIGGASQAVISTATAPLRSEVGLPVNIPQEVALAAGGGAVFGAGIRGLAAAWGRFKAGRAPAGTEAPGVVRDSGEETPASESPSVPRYVQDAGNVVTREAMGLSGDPARGAGPSAEAAHARNLAEAEAAIVAGREPEIQPDIFASGGWRPGRVFDSEGREVGVRYEVVEADSLVVSQRDDLSANPAYPSNLQPRDRTRAASTDQIAGIAARLEPARLGPSSDAATGAPIVGPDGVVESGNGRVLALRQVYAAGRSDGYRAFLREIGFDDTGFTNPVLIARRTSALDDAERAAFTSAANRATALRMSAPEQALADARLIDGPLLEKVAGGAVDSADNRDFVRGFFGKLPKEERGGLIDRHGVLSQEGIRRAESALLARAYGDPALLARILESQEAGVKTLGGSLLDAAGRWSAMRAEVAAGRVPAGMDVTADLLAAFRLVERARSERVPVARLVDQVEMFEAPSPMTRALLRLMFRNAEMTQAASRGAVARGLTGYADEAIKNTTEARLFGEPLEASDVLGTALRQAGREDLVPEAEAAVVPMKARERMVEDDIDDGVLRKLDDLRDAAQDDGRELRVAVTTVDEFGNEAVEMRAVSDLVNEADAEIAAAREIEACASGTPLGEAAE